MHLDELRALFLSDSLCALTLRCEIDTLLEIDTLRYAAVLEVTADAVDFEIDILSAMTFS